MNLDRIEELREYATKVSKRAGGECIVESSELLDLLDHARAMLRLEEWLRGPENFVGTMELVGAGDYWVALENYDHGSDCAYPARSARRATLAEAINAALDEAETDR